MRKRTSSLFALAVLGVCCSAANAGELDAVSRLYGEHKYAEALSLVGQYLAARPNDVNGHYWRALCLHGTNQIQQARSEYSWVAQTAPTTPVGQKARAAADGLAGYRTSRAASGASQPYGTISHNPAPAATSSVAAGKSSGNPAAVAPPKITVYEFWTTGCKTCRNYEPVFAAVSQQMADAGEFKSMDSGDPAYSNLLNKFNVSCYPTTIILNSAGKEVDRLEGGTNEAGLTKMINKARGLLSL